MTHQPILCGIALLLVACSGGDGTAPIDATATDATATDATATDATAIDAMAFDGEATPPLQGCNPLAAEWDCMLPYPTDFFLAPDPKMPSGRRIALPDSVAPVTINGVRFDPNVIRAADGFGHHPPILALLPEGIDPSSLLPHTADVAISLSDASTTVLLDATTGERILHFTETDPNAADDAQRVLFIRPLVRLHNGTRYVVALRNLKNKAGAPHTVPAGFRKLRDASPGLTGDLATLAARYDTDVFAPLGAANVARAELQLAWDFTTESFANVTNDLLGARKDAMTRLQKGAPAMKVTSVKDDVDAHIARRIDGTFRAPLYLDDPAPGGRLHRDATGAVAFTGETDVPFVLLIPRGVTETFDADGPVRVLQFGHGFFGGCKELTEGFVPKFLKKSKMIGVCTDWWGMTFSDSVIVVQDMLTDLSMTTRFVDRVHQAMVNQMALTYAMRGPATALEATQQGGKPLFDPMQIYFYGISQGHILGSTFVTISPHIDRAVLSVGGGSWTLMMSRARPFSAFLDVIQSQIPGWLETQKLIALLAPSMDPIDPLTWAPHQLADTLDGAPPTRRNLQHTGIGDTQVPNLASHLLARATGVKHVQPSPRPIVGLDPVALPYSGAGLEEFDFHISPLPDLEAKAPPQGNPVHEAVRALAASMAQADAFFHPNGQIQQTCDGVCDPE